MDDVVGEYDVFLSYSHVDEPQARTVQRGLQRLARPWYRAQAMRVCRDRTSLPAGQDLWPALQARLQRSRWLVLLASPEAAQAPWVAREVAWWRRHHTVDGGVDRLIIVRTDGVLVWGPRDVDWSATTCLPEEALRGAFRETPIWGELPRRSAGSYMGLLPAALERPGARWLLRTADERRAAAVLRRAVVDVAANVRGVPRERMDRSHLRAGRVARASAGVALVLVVALLAVLVVVQGVADERRDAVVAAALHQRAVQVRDADPRLAVQLEVAAVRLHDDTATRARLVDTLTTSTLRGRVPGAALAFDPVRPVAATTVDGATALWDVSAPQAVRRLGTGAALPADVDDDDAAVAFSPDGRLLATALPDGAVALDDVTDPARPVARGATPALPRETGTASPSVVAFTPDGRGLLVAINQAAPVLWEVTDPQHPRPAWTMPTPIDGPPVLALSGDGRTLAVGRGPIVELWDLPGRRLLRTLPDPDQGVTALAFSPAGPLVVGRVDGGVELWEAGDPARLPRSTTVRGGGKGISSVAVRRDGATMVTADSAGDIVTWDLRRPAGPEPVGEARPAGPLHRRGVAFSWDGATVGSHGGTLWQAGDPGLPTVTSPPILTEDLGDGAASDKNAQVAVAADGRTAVVRSTRAPPLVVDLTGTRPARAFPARESFANPTFAPSGHLLAASWGTTVAVWDTGLPLDAPRILAGDARHDAGTGPFSPDGRTLAVTVENAGVALVDVTTGNRVRPSIPVPDLAPAAFAPDGRTLALVSPAGDTTLYDLEALGPPAPLGPPLPAPTPDGLAASASASFSPDATKMATLSSAGTAILWDVTDRAAPEQLGPPIGDGDEPAVSDVAFSRDGSLLLTIDTDDRFVARDITDPTVPAPLGRPVPVTALRTGALAALADARTVVAGGGPGGLSLVDLGALLDLRDHAPQRGCAIAGGGLTPEDWARYAPDVPYRDSCAT